MIKQQRPNNKDQMRIIFLRKISDYNQRIFYHIWSLVFEYLLIEIGLTNEEDIYPNHLNIAGFWLWDEPFGV